MLQSADTIGQNNDFIFAITLSRYACEEARNRSISALGRRQQLFYTDSTQSIYTSNSQVAVENTEEYVCNRTVKNIVASELIS